MHSLRVCQGERGLVKPNNVTVQEIIADIGAILNKINTVIGDHEQRLRLIEEADLKIELELLKSRILAISDQKKQTEALQALKSLCDTLGISDLDFAKS
jgi:histidinol phosphatase-like enzyme